MTTLKAVATILHHTMKDCDYIDNYDEVINSSLLEHGLSSTMEFHNDILTAIIFINDHTGSKIDLADFITTFNEQVEQTSSTI